MGLVQTLEHENLDICIETLTLLAEFSDEDMIASYGESLTKLTKVLLENSIMSVVLRVCIQAVREMDEENDLVYRTCVGVIEKSL